MKNTILVRTQATHEDGDSESTRGEETCDSICECVGGADDGSLVEPLIELDGNLALAVIVDDRDSPM